MNRLDSLQNQMKLFTKEPVFTFSQAKYGSEWYVSLLKGSRRRFFFREVLTLYFVVMADTDTVCNMSVLFMKYIARCGFTIHGGITLGHGRHY